MSTPVQLPPHRPRARGYTGAYALLVMVLLLGLDHLLGWGWFCC